MATSIKPRSETQESMLVGDHKNADPWGATQFSSKHQSVAFTASGQNPFGDETSSSDSFTANAFKDDPFNAFGSAASSNRKQEGSSWHRSSPALNPFCDADDELNDEANQAGHIHRSGSAISSDEKKSDESDFCEIGQFRNTDVVSFSTRRTSTGSKSSSATQQSPSDGSLISPISNNSSRSPKLNPNASTSLHSSNSPMLLGGSDINERLLDGEERYGVNTTYEADSGNSIETANHVNMSQAPSRGPSSVYRTFVDEVEPSAPVADRGGRFLKNERGNPQGKGHTGDLQLPEILLTEATVLSSDTSSFEIVNSTEGVSEGRTRLLESTAADDETSLNGEPNRDKRSKGFVFKVADSEEDTADVDDADLGAGRTILIGETIHNADNESATGHLNAGDNHQDMIMNISAINPTDDDDEKSAPEFKSTTLGQVPSLGGRRRSVPCEGVSDKKDDFVDLVRSTRTHSVGNDEIPPETLAAPQKPKMLTSSPITARRMSGEHEKNMSPLQKWREQFRQRIVLLDAQEQKAIEHLKMEAKRSVDQWYARRQDTIRTQHAAHLENESRVRGLSDGDRQNAQAIWDRMTALAVDLQRMQKADDVTKDVSRMKSLLHLLKTRPPLEKFPFACLSRSSTLTS